MLDPLLVLAFTQTGKLNKLCHNSVQLYFCATFAEVFVFVRFSLMVQELQGGIHKAEHHLLAGHKLPQVDNCHFKIPTLSLFLYKEKKTYNV